MRVKSRPQVAVEVIDDCPGMENLPDARGIFACDAQDHVEEFVQTKSLPYHRPHGYVSGFFFRVTGGNRFGQRHDASIRGARLKSRYENEQSERLSKEVRIRLGPLSSQESGPSVDPVRATISLRAHHTGAFPIIY